MSYADYLSVNTPIQDSRALVYVALNRDGPVFYMASSCRAWGCLLAWFLAAPVPHGRSRYVAAAECEKGPSPPMRAPGVKHEMHGR